MNLETWSFADYRNGLCPLDLVGAPKSLQPEDEEEDSQPMPPGMFEREFALYTRDQERYKNSNPPALVVKLLAVDEERRLREIANSRPDTRTVDQLTDEEITARVLPAIANMKPDIRASLSNGLDHLIERCVKPTRIAEAREIASQILRFLDRCAGQSASD